MTNPAMKISGLGWISIARETRAKARSSLLMAKELKRIKTRACKGVDHSRWLSCLFRDRLCCLFHLPFCGSRQQLRVDLIERTGQLGLKSKGEGVLPARTATRVSPFCSINQIARQQQTDQPIMGMTLYWITDVRP